MLCTHISQQGLLQTALHNTCRSLVIAGDQLATDDRRADGFRSVDNLLDTRDAQSDIHGCDTGEMESLQGHLRSRLTDGLGPYCPYGRPCTDVRTRRDEPYILRTWLDLGLDIFLPADVQERFQLSVRDLQLVINDRLFGI